MSLHQPADHQTLAANTNRRDGTDARQSSFWRSKGGLVALAFLLIAAFFLLSEHRAHVLGYLPFLLLLACPLLHLFMHGGHRGHGGGAGHGTTAARSDRSNSPPEGV